MLDLLGSIVGTAAIFVDAVAILFILPLTLRQRLTAGAIAGAWVGLATALAAAGALSASSNQPVPWIGVLFAAPLMAAALGSVLSSKFRAMLVAIPTELLIGLNALRVLGFLFLALALVGRLSGPFPYFAGIGDIITGAAAVFLSARVARGDSAGIVAWNAFGALDLIVAVGLGITTAQGNLQVFHVGVGSGAMQHLPYALVPTVLVPFYLITHAVVAAQLAARRRVQILATA